MRLVLSTLVAVAIGYAILLAFVFWFQSRLVYFPNMGRELAGTPRDAGLEYDEVWLDTSDGERLHAWYVPAPQARGVVLVFHGNAGNISHRIDYAIMLQRLGYSTFIPEYRGYGRSSGVPSEQGTYRDAEAAWRHLTETRGFAPQHIALLGESLGAAVAAWLATEREPGALVLASAFTSVPDLGAEVYPFLPVRLLSRYRYDARAALARVRAPVLVAHSPQDEIVPYRHGRALFEAAREPKAFLEMRGGHNDGFLFMDESWVRALGAFLDQHLGANPARSPGRV
jgi:fermentation-respiration switch protein FrsA (DUF1100 family)